MSNEVYGLPLTKEQQIRDDVMIALINKGYPTQRLERVAERLVTYILEGAKEEPKTVKKLPVMLPPALESKSNVRLMDDGTLSIEFEDPDLAANIFENVDLYGLSFFYKSDSPVDTTKDN